jgi:hypothetical protein
VTRAQREERRRRSHDGGGQHLISRDRRGDRKRAELHGETGGVVLTVSRRGRREPPGGEVVRLTSTTNASPARSAIVIGARHRAQHDDVGASSHEV